MVRLPVLSSDRPATRAKHVRRIRGARYLGFRCTHCGNCCVDTIVPVTAEDVQRLARGTGLGAEQIVAFYAGDEFDDGGEGLSFAELDIGPRILGLRRRLDPERDEEACRFFQHDRCTVYADRPITCRLWPFSLGFDEAGQVNRLELNDSVECQYALDGAIDLPALKRDWQHDDEQDDRWQRTIARWNQRHRGGTRREFLAYVGLRRAR